MTRGMIPTDWSPDSRRLTFVAARHPDRDHDHAVDIFVADADGGEVANTRLRSRAQLQPCAAYQ